MGLGEEGIQQAREAFEILGQHGDTRGQARCLVTLAFSLLQVKQLDAAEEAVTRAMDLYKNHDQHRLSQCHQILGRIQKSRGDREKAIHHLEASLRIISSVDLRYESSETHLALAILYIEEGKLDDAHAHLEHVESLAGDDMLSLGYAFFHGARVLLERKGFEEGKSGALRALAIFEEIGATRAAELAGRYIRAIEQLDRVRRL